MKRKIISYLGVLYVAFACIMASGSSLHQRHSNRPNAEETTSVGGTVERSHQAGERLSGYSTGNKNTNANRPSSSRGQEQRLRLSRTTSKARENKAEKISKNSAPAVIYMPNNYMLVFTSSWCSGCRQMKPVIENLKKSGYAILLIDSDKNKNKFSEYGVDQMPTFIIYESQKEVKRLVGVVSVEEILRYLKMSEAYQLW